MKKVTKLQKALSLGQTVLIEFVKKDQTPRRAWVTKNLEVIPEDKHPKGVKSKSNKTGLINLFDVYKKDWICCFAEKITMVKTPPTAAQLRRQAERKERWALVEKIYANYHFTYAEALKIASGKTVDRCHLHNLSF